MAINFGQQINQALSSTLDRNQRGRVQAQRLAQQIQEQQFNQRMKGMVQNLRERQFQMQQEAQEEELINNAFQQRMAEDREKRLKKESDARIANMGSEGDDGLNPNTRVNALLSIINGLQGQRSETEDRIKDTKEEMEELTDPIRGDRPEKPEDGWFFGMPAPSEEEVGRYNRELESFQQDSTQVANTIESDQENLSQVDRLIKMLRGEVAQTIGVNDENRQQSSGPIKSSVFE